MLLGLFSILFYPKDTKNDKGGLDAVADYTLEMFDGETITLSVDESIEIFYEANFVLDNLYLEYGSDIVEISGNKLHATFMGQEDVVFATIINNKAIRATARIVVKNRERVYVSPNTKYDLKDYSKDLEVKVENENICKLENNQVKFLSNGKTSISFTNKYTKLAINVVGIDVKFYIDEKETTLSNIPNNSLVIIDTNGYDFKIINCQNAKLNKALSGFMIYTTSDDLNFSFTMLIEDEIELTFKGSFLTEII